MTPGSEVVSPPSFNQKQQRIQQWKSSVETKLQLLITQAATIRKQVNEAKTNTKKIYFNKKFKKINDQVLQLVGTMQRLESLEKEQDNASSSTN